MRLKTLRGLPPDAVAVEPLPFWIEGGFYSRRYECPNGSAYEAVAKDDQFTKVVAVFQIREAAQLVLPGVTSCQ